MFDHNPPHPDQTVGEIYRLAKEMSDRAVAVVHVRFSGGINELHVSAYEVQDVEIVGGRRFLRWDADTDTLYDKVCSADDHRTLIEIESKLKELLP